MLRKLSLAIAVSCASNGVAWAVDVPSTVKTDLVSVYQEAVDNNADLAAARADYGARREVVPQARAGLLPNLSADAEMLNTRTKLDEPSITSNRSGNSWSATLAQPIFRADRWFQLQAAEAVNEQAALELSATEQNLILQTAQSYFAVLRAQDNLAATKAEEAAFKRQLDQSNERFDVGLSDKTDVLQSQASYDTARANRIIAERQVQDAFEALVTLTNREYTSIQGVVHTLPVQVPTPNDAKAWVETAGRQNLNLLATNYAVSAAEETLRQRKAGHAPTLDAVAKYQKGDNDSLGFTNPAPQQNVRYGGDVEQTSVGLQLNIPIYSGGLTSSQVREAYQRLSQSEQQRESLRRQVVENTRNLHRAVNTDVEQVQARKQSIISNQSALEATEIGYQVGTRNIVDVLDAQRQLYTSVRDYNNSRYDYILDNLSLKQAAGTLSPQDLQDLKRYLKPDYNPDKDFLPPDLAAAAAKNFEPAKKPVQKSADKRIQAIEQALQRALIGPHHRPARLAHALGVLRQFHQTAHRTGQPVSIINLLQRTRLAQHRADFEEVEHMRPHEHRQGQRRRLQRIVPTGRHQATTDEGNVGQGIQEQQLTHGVAQQHAGLRIDRRCRRTAHGGELLAAQRMHRIEALGMARHQDQQGIAMHLQQLPMRLQNQRILAVMGTRGNPHRALFGAPLLTQCPGSRQQLPVDLQVELDRTGDLHALRARAQVTKALRLGFGLHGDQAHFRQHRPSQFGKAPVAACRTLGQSRVGQRHRNSAFGALVDVVGPQLGFHDDAQLRLHMVEKSPGRPRQIVGQVAMLYAWFVGEHGANTLGTGRCHAGKRDRQFRVGLEQGTHHGRGSNALANRHSMYPDAALAHCRQLASKALADALPIGRRLASAQVQAQRNQRQAQVKQQGIECSVHGAGVYPIARRCTAKRSASHCAAGPRGASRRQASSATSAGGRHSLSSSTMCAW